MFHDSDPGFLVLLVNPHIYALLFVAGIIHDFCEVRTFLDWWLWLCSEIGWGVEFALNCLEKKNNAAWHYYITDNMSEVHILVEGEYFETGFYYNLNCIVYYGLYILTRFGDKVFKMQQTWLNWCCIDLSLLNICSCSFVILIQAHHRIHCL